MELGCSTLLYGGFPVEVALEHISRAGYRAIELAAIPGMGDHLSQEVYQSPTLLKELSRKIADSGLTLESIGASTNLLNPDARQRFIRLMEVGGVLGAPAITTGSGGVSDDEESFKTVVNLLNELSRVVRETGVKISIKPHVNCAVYSTRTALRLMEHVDPNYIGLNVDASHLWRTPEQENPEETIPSLLPYLCTARIRDTKGREKPIGSVEDQIPGGGAMNLPAII
ncbi:MAG TPA: sugar phosphate isomerase/epimerase, partial [Chthonomonas sp.]|uniref:sugar phosphate isomerase/epimerase family protein n=1 Tax=Chthonomonas sp. TaxID=2282153 RepID=UPI002B4B8A15